MGPISDNMDFSTIKGWSYRRCREPMKPACNRFSSGTARGRYRRPPAERLAGRHAQKQYGQISCNGSNVPMTRRISVTADKLQKWFREYLSTHIDVIQMGSALDVPIRDLGLKSIDVLAIPGDLGDEFRVLYSRFGRLG